MNDPNSNRRPSKLSTGRLAALSLAALAFAAYETGVAYRQPDVANCIWAGIGWVCVAFMAGLCWEHRRQK